MSIGYAGLALGVKNTDYKDLNLEDLNVEKRNETISYNLNSFENLLDYNMMNKIGIYRIPSELISFGSSQAVNHPWWENFESELFSLGNKIREAEIRISIDGTKTTMINSSDEITASDAAIDLEYYARLLDYMMLGPEHKIITHVGDNYGGKKEGLERFKKKFNGLDDFVKRRLVLENDGTYYDIEDVICLGRILHLPVVFHNRNYELNPSTLEKENVEWIRECRETWRDHDGIQIVHYAGENPENSADSLAETIGIKAFLTFYEKMDSSLDVVLEAEDRNLSAVKCINCTRNHKDIKFLELEWRKYKYSILENSHRAYLKIRSLLKDKDNYPVIPFYMLIEEALAGKKREGFVNAAQHVWGYFKKCATEKEKTDFLIKMEEYKLGRLTKEDIKKILWVLSEKYDMKYLLESYYFIL